MIFQRGEYTKPRGFGICFYCFWKLSARGVYLGKYGVLCMNVWSFSKKTTFCEWIFVCMYAYKCMLYPVRQRMKKCFPSRVVRPWRRWWARWRLFPLVLLPNVQTVVKLPMKDGVNKSVFTLPVAVQCRIARLWLAPAVHLTWIANSGHSGSFIGRSPSAQQGVHCRITEPLKRKRNDFRSTLRFDRTIQWPTNHCIPEKTPYSISRSHYFSHHPKRCKKWSEPEDLDNSGRKLILKWQSVDWLIGYTKNAMGLISWLIDWVH